MSKRNKPKPRQLLVEGKNDRHVIWALCQKYQVPETFSVEIVVDDDTDDRNTQGIEELLNDLPLVLKEENLEILGIVVDADHNLASRWQSVSNKLKEFGYEEIPKVLPEIGWIHIQEEKPIIGVWIMPNNKLPGMLEDFVRYLIPANDKLQEKVVILLDEIEKEELNLYSSTHRPKALINSWLALQEEPGMN